MSGTDTPQWDYIAELAEEEGIEIDLIRFSDYVQPNIALAEEEIDANAFQTVSYFDNFKEEHGFDHLEAIAATVLAPLGLYSDEYERVEDIPEGAEIAIANEVTNQARNLMLLEEAGLLELEDDFGVTSGLDDIKENPLNLTLTPVQPANAPRIMADIDAAIINNGIAVDAGLSLLMMPLPLKMRRLRLISILSLHVRTMLMIQRCKRLSTFTKAKKLNNLF
ncbi:methionine ABC transporter substrate-binding protein [Geomicrobium sp. JCM 19037]|nr:methionine ABC transporter substrate-binding protein [Geomicrobium sp. JCM 19037]